MSMRVLVTRPALDAARTAERLNARGHKALIDPVIEIEPLPQNIPQGNFTALVLTSANAVRVAAKLDTLAPLKTLPVFTVGTHTAEVVREHGFTDVATAAGDVNALGALMLAELRGQMQMQVPLHLLHLTGEDRAGDLAGVLSRSGIRIDTVAIYRARAADALKHETVIAFRSDKVAVVLHYSERSAAIFVQLAEAAHIIDRIVAVRHLCLSETVAAPLKLVGVHPEVAPAPEEDALLELLGP
jgi:uroporphyrinogen-III synthase